MKFVNTCFLFVLLLFVFGCSTPKGGECEELSKELQRLEKEIGVLHEQLENQKIKTHVSFMQIGSSPNTPFEDFLFAVDDYLNGFVDVGLDGCVTTCAKIRDRELKDECFANCYRDFPLTLR